MADKKLYVLYIPGLGDANVSGQKLAIRTWRLWGVKAEVLQMHWDDTEAWESKLKRLTSRIEALTAQAEQVALVGASAGASAVINAYATHKSQLVGCVLVAGKVNHPAAIGTTYHQNNPAFVESAYACEKALATLADSDRTRILSRYGMLDEIVPKKDSRIDGARNQMVPTFEHALTIAAQIVFGAPTFLRFLKKLAN